MVIRDANTDYLRAISILGVVYIHSGGAYASMFRFCVPVFIGLFAYYIEREVLIRNASGMGVVKVCYKRFIRLLVPYLVWTFIYLAYRYPLAELFLMPIHTLVFGQLGGYGFAGQYFFIVVFQILLIYPMLRKLTVDDKTAMVSLYLLLVFNYTLTYGLSGTQLANKLWLRPFVYYLPYVLYGIMLAKHGSRALSGLSSKSLLGVSLIATIIASYELSSLPETTVYIAPSVSLASLAMLSLISKPILRVPLGRYLQWVGERSLPIFLLNPMVISMVKHWLDVYPTILSVLVMALALLLTQTLQYLGLGPILGIRRRRQT